MRRIYEWKKIISASANRFLASFCFVFVIHRAYSKTKINPFWRVVLSVEWIIINKVSFYGLYYYHYNYFLMLISYVAVCCIVNRNLNVIKNNYLFDQIKPTWTQWKCLELNEMNTNSYTQLMAYNHFLHCYITITKLKFFAF